MVLFKKFREKRINQIVESIHKKNILKRYVMLLTGTLIVAFAFNLSGFETAPLEFHHLH